MIMGGLIDKHDHHITIDGKHKMIQNGDEVHQILQHQIEHEQQLFEDNDHALVDGMFRV